MAIARVQTATPAAAQSVTSQTLTFGSALTPGNLVAVATALNNAGSSALLPSSDTGIRWFSTSKYDNTNSNGCILSVSFGVVCGSGITSVTVSDAGAGTIAAVGAEYSGGVSVLDRYAESGGNPSGGITVGTTGTTTQANELWVGAVGCRGNVTFSSPGNGFSIVSSVGTTAANSSDRSVCLLEKIVSATGSASFTLSSNAGNGFAGIVAALRAEATGGGESKARRVNAGGV